jgi:hypothetical protein
MRRSCRKSTYHFHPDDGFPGTGGFYYDSTAVPKTPNLIYVDGDLHVRDDLTVYGVFIVEGDVLLNSNARINGVLYLPNVSSRIYRIFERFGFGVCAEQPADSRADVEVRTVSSGSGSEVMDLGFRISSLEFRFRVKE